MKLFGKKTQADPRRQDDTMTGGRRAGETENPYLSARRTWNDHTSSQVWSRMVWQTVAILSLMIVLAAVGGIIHIGSQSKFVPYVVQVDKLGQIAASGPIMASSKVPQVSISATVSDFIQNARLVTPDGNLQRKAIFRLYAHLSPNDPATMKMNDWLNGAADSSPFKRAEKVMVSTEVTNVLQQTPETWQVDWTETTRSRQGSLASPPVHMRALVTIYIAPPTPNTNQDQLRRNPLGIYVRDFSWSPVM
jgi:type IV secretory pathway TrbF-like protein